MRKKISLEILQRSRYKKMKLNLKILTLTIIMLLTFTPIKAFSLVFVLLYLLRDILLRRLYLLNLSILLLLFSMNLFSEFICLHGENLYLFNFMLFLIFVSPIIALISFKGKKNYDPLYIKKSIELFLMVQIIFSFIQIGYSFLKTKTFDLATGDAVAGTLRFPLVIKPDASNVIFTFTLILILYVYISYFEKKANKLIIILTSIVIFLASVNHLLIAVFISLFLTTFFRSPFKIFLSFLTTIVVYRLLQPVNYDIIAKRLLLILYLLKDPALLDSISLKGEYIFNFLSDFKNYLWTFILFGLGAGTYSSRAALFLSGEYVEHFHWKSISPYFANNTYILWNELLERPPWLAGSFNYPYSSITSFVAELGLLGSILIFYLLYSRLKRQKIFSRSQLFFFFSFILVAGIVDNYYEYFQAWFIFYVVISHLPPKQYNKEKFKWTLKK